jgi:predicted nuclease with TOPRIM domain
MIVDNSVVAPNENEIESGDSSVHDKDSIIEDLKNQLNSLRGKTEELLGETKKAKAKAREEMEAKERAKLEKAKKEGDFEQLLKSSENERKSLSDRLNDLQGKISSEKLRTESLKLAGELADGANAELLSEFIAKRLKYTDDGMRVLDHNGDLTVSSAEDLPFDKMHPVKQMEFIKKGGKVVDN